MQISATRGAACWHLDVAAPELVSGPAGRWTHDHELTPSPNTREKDETDEEIAQT